MNTNPQATPRSSILCSPGRWRLRQFLTGTVMFFGIWTTGHSLEAQHQPLFWLNYEPKPTSTRTIGAKRPFAVIARSLTGVEGSGYSLADKIMNGQGGGSSVSPIELAELPLDHPQLARNGASSCAAAACHGGPRPGTADPQAPRGSEYSLWLESDPHARSRQTLCGDASVDILRRLHILVDGQIVNQSAYENCLACHDTYSAQPEHCCEQVTREGVGCEACHGPSEHWIDRHYLRDWDALSERNNGFVPLTDLITRARVCAKCHVGDADRDMNHDLIAAGHPALRYEFATYHTKLPKHWREVEVGDETRFESQLWWAGQVASLDASLALLEARATKNQPASTWPEFSAYDCASCHHELSLVLRPPGETSHKALPTYSTWHDSGVRMLIRQRRASGQSSDHDEALLASLDDLRVVMQSKATPDPIATANAARQARSKLGHWLQVNKTWQSDWDAYQLTDLVIHASASPNVSLSWETAAQFYLAAVASRAAWPGGTTGSAAHTANELRRTLSYPAARNGTPFPFDSHEKTGISPERLSATLDSLGRALAEPHPELQ